MEERAICSPWANLLIQTRPRLVSKRMEFGFLPTVAMKAVIALLAAICKGADERGAVPIGTRRLVIVEFMGFSPEVLQVVGIHAFGLIMR